MKVNKYLLHFRGKGALVEIPWGATSDYYGALQDAFFTAALNGRKKPRFDWPDMFCLDDRQMSEGVHFHSELAGAGGASFQIYGLPDTTKQALKMAEEKIARERDVVRLKVYHVKKFITFPLPEINISATRNHL